MAKLEIGHYLNKERKENGSFKKCWRFWVIIKGWEISLDKVKDFIKSMLYSNH